MFHAVDNTCKQREGKQSMSPRPLIHLTTAIAPRTFWDLSTFSLALIRQLAEGEPVSRAQLATILHQPEEIISEALRQLKDVVFDEEGRVVGAGLSAAHALSFRGPGTQVVRLVRPGYPDLPIAAWTLGAGLVCVSCDRDTHPSDRHSRGH